MVCSADCCNEENSYSVLFFNWTVCTANRCNWEKSYLVLFSVFELFALQTVNNYGNVIYF